MSDEKDGYRDLRAHISMEGAVLAIREGRIPMGRPEIAIGRRAGPVVFAVFEEGTAHEGGAPLFLLTLSDDAARQLADGLLSAIDIRIGGDA